MRKQFSMAMAIAAGAVAVGFSCVASAQVTSNDDFTQRHDNNSWVTFDGACLTAGDGTRQHSCLRWFGLLRQPGANRRL